MDNNILGRIGTLFQKVSPFRPCRRYRYVQSAVIYPATGQ